MRSSAGFTRALAHVAPDVPAVYRDGDLAGIDQRKVYFGQTEAGNLDIEVAVDQRLQLDREDLLVEGVQRHLEDGQERGLRGRELADERAERNHLYGRRSSAQSVAQSARFRHRLKC